jgi:hypothetical protein
MTVDSGDPSDVDGPGAPRDTEGAVVNDAADTAIDQEFRCYLDGLEGPFLENFARFGATSSRVVSEALFRELVLAPPDHRKILGMRIVEEYLDAVGGLMALYTALRNRATIPVLTTFMAHRLTAESAAAFNRSILGRPPDYVLRDLGLPTRADVAAAREGVSKRDYRQLSAALTAVTSGLQRATKAEQGALLLLADGLEKSSMLTNSLDWLPDRSMPPNQVALMVLEERRHRIATHFITIDERQLEQFVLAVGTISQACRDLIWLYLRLRDGGAGEFRPNPTD